MLAIYIDNSLKKSRDFTLSLRKQLQNTFMLRCSLMSLLLLHMVVSSDHPSPADKRFFPGIREWSEPQLTPLPLLSHQDVQASIRLELPPTWRKTAASLSWNKNNPITFITPDQESCSLSILVPSHIAAHQLSFTLGACPR